jgi:hypothetical protein
VCAESITARLAEAATCARGDGDRELTVRQSLIEVVGGALLLPLDLARGKIQLSQGRKRFRVQNPTSVMGFDGLEMAK